MDRSLFFTILVGAIRAHHLDGIGKVFLELFDELRTFLSQHVRARSIDLLRGRCQLHCPDVARRPFERVRKPGKVYEPNKELTAKYAEGFKTFMQLYPSLKGLNEGLRAMA